MSDQVTSIQSEVVVTLGETKLPGHLAVPSGAQGLIVFAHGSGSSRFSSRNRFVAAQLNSAGFATLLFDLLTAEEHEVDERTRELRFDIGLLAQRLTGTVDWLGAQPGTRHLNIGLFGASTGAAAALVTAADRPQMVAAVVSRGGRPDLAGRALGRVRAPVLMIVGGGDQTVLSLNRQAGEAMGCPMRITIVPHATHLFEEAGALEQVAALAGEWFAAYLHERNRGEQSQPAIQQ